MTTRIEHIRRQRAKVDTANVFAAVCGRCRYGIAPLRGAKNQGRGVCALSAWAILWGAPACESFRYKGQTPRDDRDNRRPRAPTPRPLAPAGVE